MKCSTTYVLKLLVVTAALTVGAGSLPAVAEQDQKKGDFVSGAREWADNCTRCHNVRDPRELRDDQWKSTIYHMRLRAGLTGQQTRDILEFMRRSN